MCKPWWLILKIVYWELFFKCLAMDYVENKGCFYHLIQSTWCKIQELGLGTKYIIDELHFFCGMINSLAFLSLGDVDESMRYLKTVIPQDPPEIEELLTYFDCTCVSGSFRLIQQPGAMPSVALLPLRMSHIPPIIYGMCMMLPWTTMLVPTTSVKGGIINPQLRWSLKSFSLVCHWMVSAWRSDSTLIIIIKQDVVGNLLQRRVGRHYVQLQDRLYNKCVGRGEDHKTVVEFLHGTGWNIRLINQH